MSEYREELIAALNKLGAQHGYMHTAEAAADRLGGVMQRNLAQKLNGENRSGAPVYILEMQRSGIEIWRCSKNLGDLGSRLRFVDENGEAHRYVVKYVEHEIGPGARTNVYHVIVDEIGI